MAIEILRYLGIGKETTFGTAVAALFHMDIASASLDTPDDPNILSEGGLTRFSRHQVPGAYVPEGDIESVAEISTLYYILYLLLGAISTTDNTTGVTDESFDTGVAETEKSQDLVQDPCVPGTWTMDDTTPQQVAHDDGFGNIVEDNASGITGTIDYTRKFDGSDGASIKMAGLQVSTNYDMDYSYGYYEHVITPQTTSPLLSATLRLGKDVFEHVFAGCGFSQLSIAIEKELGMITLTVIGSKDSKATLTAKASLLIPQDFPIPFHKVTVKQADYGSTLADVSCEIEALTLTFNNNADGEGGVAFCSRFPQNIYCAALDVDFEMTLAFESTDDLEDFWGGTTEPSANGTQEKVMQFKLDGRNSGDVTFDFYRVIYQSLKTAPSGRDRIIQAITGKALYDEGEDLIVKATANSIQDW